MSLVHVRGEEYSARLRQALKGTSREAANPSSSINSGSSAAYSSIPSFTSNSFMWSRIFLLTALTPTVAVRVVEPHQCGEVACAAATALLPVVTEAMRGCPSWFTCGERRRASVREGEEETERQRGTPQQGGNLLKEDELSGYISLFTHCPVRPEKGGGRPWPVLSLTTRTVRHAQHTHTARAHAHTAHTTHTQHIVLVRLECFLGTKGC